ncbi:LamG domain-containing protein [Candidatus Pacearchaeota archaeon]|nr:LamG domain-containing protein [Candidatus Pacearchaeota archaeon]
MKKRMNKKSSVIEDTYLGIFAFIVLASLSFIFALGSASYNITSPTISGGGGNMTSSSYANTLIFEEITGNVTGTSYNNCFGFFCLSFRNFPLIDFIFPTPVNATSTGNASVYVNVSIVERSLEEVKWNWNGTNYTLYNDSLVLLMNFDNVSSLGEGTSANKTVDLSGYGNNGTIINMSVVGGNYTDGKYGKALSFDGVGDYIDAGAFDLVEGSSQITISLWAKQSIHHAGSYVSKDGNNGFHIQPWSDQKIYWSINTSTNRAISSAGAYPLDQWYHVVGTYNGSDLKIYIDGLENASSSKTTLIPTDTDNLQIGRPTSTTFNGFIDNIMIWNRSLSSDEVYQLYVSNLYRYNTTQWYLLVNQSKNATNNLDKGTYTYFASAKNKAFNENRTDVRSITISNTPPTNLTDISINSTNGNNKTLQNLSCYTTINDLNADKVNVSIRWYKNATLNLTIEDNASYVNGTLFIGILSHQNTTKNEIWSCGLRFFDGEIFSNWTNSSSPPNVTIVNTLPTVALTDPANGNATTDRTPNFSYSGSDDDSDSLEYEINLTAYYTGGGRRQSCDQYLNKNIVGSATVFAPTTYLKCLIDNGYYFNWTVRAYDGDGYGDWNESERNITIQSDISVSLPVSVVNFGTLNVSKSDNTSDDSPAPFIIRNDGNADQNISVNFTQIFDRVTIPNESLRFMIRNLTAGCFIVANTTTSWTNAPTATTPIIHRLNFTSGYQDGCSNSSVDIHIKVPSDEPPGDKSSVVTFISSLGEPGYGNDTG